MKQNTFVRNMFPHVVELDINVFEASMKCGVFGECDRS